MIGRILLCDGCGTPAGATPCVEGKHTRQVANRGTIRKVTLGRWNGKSVTRDLCEACRLSAVGVRFQQQYVDWEGRGWGVWIPERFLRVSP